MRDRVANFAERLATDPDDPEFGAFRRGESVGLSARRDFLDAVSRQLDRAVTPSKRGRKPKAAKPQKGYGGRATVSPRKSNGSSRLWRFPTTTFFGASTPGCGSRPPHRGDFENRLSRSLEILVF